jgi:hypothetical protein
MRGRTCGESPNNPAAEPSASNLKALLNWAEVDGHRPKTLNRLRAKANWDRCGYQPSPTGLEPRCSWSPSVWSENVNSVGLIGIGTQIRKDRSFKGAFGFL